jgi:hypothetical protein
MNWCSSCTRGFSAGKNMLARLSAFSSLVEVYVPLGLFRSGYLLASIVCGVVLHVSVDCPDVISTYMFYPLLPVLRFGLLNGFGEGFVDAFEGLVRGMFWESTPLEV